MDTYAASESHNVKMASKLTYTYYCSFQWKREFFSR